MENRDEYRAKKRFLSKYDGKKQGWLRLLKELVVLVVIVFLIFKFVIGMSVVDGVSMYPTLKDGEVVVYTRIVPHCNRGDVVSVKMPSGDIYVKRVVATAGDEVDIHNGVLYVNGQSLDEEKVLGKTMPAEGNVTYPYTVEEGKVFVLGDNREASVDSRNFGAVLKSQVKGKIWYYFGKMF